MTHLISLLFSSGYYHELFLRGKEHLCKKMIRTKVKGTRFKAASSPESEPDFYQMAPVVVTPQHSSDEEYSYSSNSQTVETQQYAPVPQVQVQSFDPLPLFSSAPVAEPRVYEAAASSIPYAAYPDSINAVPDRSYADQVLDEAVDELFLQEALMDNDSTFGAAWDAASLGDDVSLADEQLGMLLEQLLDE